MRIPTHTYLRHTTRTAVSAWVAAICLASVVTPSVAAAAIAPPAVTVPAGTLTTVDGAALWSRHANDERAVASTIKMLNALVVRERARLDEVVTVSPKAAAIDEGDAGLVAGQRLTVAQLLDIMLVCSANDAAEALAIHIGGTEKRYVALMNAKAKRLGLTHTVAADPHGLSKRERSSAGDLAVLGRRLLADPALRRAVNKRSVRVPRPGRSDRVVPSTNHLLGEYPGITGVKTGYTRASGFCLVASAKRGNVEIVGVVLGAKSLSARFSQMRKLLDWGFAHTHVRSLVSTTTTVTVPAGADASATPLLARPAWSVSKPLLDGCGPVLRVVRPAGVTLPVLEGQRVGLLDLTYRGVVLATVPLVAAAPASLPQTATPTPAATATASP